MLTWRKDDFLRKTHRDLRRGILVNLALKRSDPERLSLPMSLEMSLFQLANQGKEKVCRRHAAVINKI